MWVSQWWLALKNSGFWLPTWLMWFGDHIPNTNPPPNLDVLTSHLRLYLFTSLAGIMQCRQKLSYLSWQNLPWIQQLVFSLSLFNEESSYHVLKLSVLFPNEWEYLDDIAGNAWPMYLQPVRDFNMLECLQSYDNDSRFSLLCHFKYKCCETDRRCAKADFRICCLAFSTKHFNTGGTAKHISANTRHIYKEGAKNQIYKTNVALLFFRNFIFMKKCKICQIYSQKSAALLFLTARMTVQNIHISLISQ